MREKMLYQGRKMSNSKKIRALTISTFVFYMIILIWITIFKCNIEAGAQSAGHLLKKMTLIERFAYALADNSINDGGIKQMLPNVLIFVPLGILVPLLRGRIAPVSTSAIAFFTTLSIECLQLVLAFGYFTYGDLICNTAGAALGIIIYALLIRKMGDTAKFKTLIFCNFLAMAISIFATVNTILNFEIYL
jgi:glycopeptide antibiotics resistance protein